MSRNMKAANSAVFQRLVAFAQDRGRPIENPASGRWVHANPEADEYLKQLKIERAISFGRYRHLAWLSYREHHYLATVGFDTQIETPELVEQEDIQGFDVCLLAELPVSPSASAVVVFDVVAAGSKDDDDYGGHQNFEVTRLFPTMRVYSSGRPIADDSVWSAFLEICVQESRYGGSWIDGRLASSIAALAQLNVPSLPYRELARSVLDLDPRSLYMSLYRCIEATYAFDKTSRLKDALEIDLAWHKLAATLESEMAWRPPEAQSLNVALAHASAIDLREACDCLGVLPGKDLQGSAGAAIYRLRNQIVHFRPTNNPLDLETIDWNRICNALVTIALDVFHRAYG